MAIQHGKREDGTIVTIIVHDDEHPRGTTLADITDPVTDDPAPEPTDPDDN